MVREDLETVRGDQVVVLETHPADPFDVEAGFEGHDVTHDDRIRALGDEVRGLGVTESGPVPAMARERLGQADAASRPRTAASTSRAGVPGRSCRSPASMAERAGLEHLTLSRSWLAVDHERVREVAPGSRARRPRSRAGRDRRWRWFAESAAPLSVAHRGPVAKSPYTIACSSIAVMAAFWTSK